ncbi:hypothetical protein J3Q64DRAFT_1828786 [Phycomyces blakesleeanus]|uniref:Uncharacterized protein n=1 Tax=Phycomyces blakesleeanus TaxID=4837 RepID=A0ABR3BFA7_PHYBL
MAAAVLACEPECRHGLAEDFAGHYAPVIDKTIRSLQASLTTSLSNTTVPASLSAVVPEDILRQNIQSAVDGTLRDFTVQSTGTTLNNGIFRVMFAEDKPFKGDCNNPKRVDRRMPPPGESWTLEECEKMDYICGNPPSICHFLPMVKERIIGRIQSQLSSSATYDNGLLVRSLVQNTKHAVYSSLTRYGAGSLSDDPHVLLLVNTLVSHTIESLDVWAATDVQQFCRTPDQKELCDGWDDAIIKEILIWP